MEKYYVVEDRAEHAGRVVEVADSDIWTSANPDGVTHQDIGGPHGTIIGVYVDATAAQAHLTQALQCDAAEQGRYCYSHNPNQYR